MFLLETVEDAFAVSPRHFQTPLEETVAASVLGKFANRVVPGRGLCVTLFDLVAVGDAVIHASSSTSTATNPIIRT